MTIKSSDVLRLAAELAFIGKADSPFIAYEKLKGNSFYVGDYLDFVGWRCSEECSEHEVMALCLAAAIAESEGD